MMTGRKNIGYGAKYEEVGEGRRELEMREVKFGNPIYNRVR